MKKSIEKLKVRIDQNLNRAERSELLSEDLIRIEDKVQGLKQVCHSVSKKLSEGANKGGTDGAAIEKRIRKTTDFVVGQTIQESGRLFNRKDESSFLGCLLCDSGHLLNDLAANQIQYEIEVEKLVIQQLVSILEAAYPPIVKEKRNLERWVLELDTIKSKMMKPSEDESREERLSEELADIQSKVDGTRECLATLMLQFLSKETEIGSVLLTYFQVKKDYHAHVAEQIGKQVSQFEELLLSSRHPVYGLELGTHLRKNGRLIAIPLQLSIVRLLDLGLEEEGLFRIAASASKIKHVKALFDAGEWAGSSLFQITDHHVFTGALKTYCRELPSPLLGKELYGDWLRLGSESRRLNGIKELLGTLPRDHRDNLAYLFHFLKLISSKALENKMTAGNLAIVMTPNLIWNTRENWSEHYEGMTETQILSNVVETLIEEAAFVFDESPIDFFDGVSCLGKNSFLLSTQSVVRAPVPTPRGSKVNSLKPVIPAKPDFPLKNGGSGESTNL